MLEWLFSWEVSSAVVALAISVGLAVLALSDYKLAKVSFMIAAADAWGGIIMWGGKYDLPAWSRSLIVFFAAGLVAVLLVQSLKYVDSKKPKTAKLDGPGSGPEASETKTNPVALGTIEMTYDMQLAGLPLAMQPYTGITIIRVKDRTHAESLFVNNPARQVSYWPKEKMGFPPSGVGIINVANHGTVPLFNVAAVVRFDLGAQKSPGGVSSLYFHLPLIESLKPTDQPCRFYVVDDSALGGLVFMPETVDADVPGGGRQKIQVAARKLTLMDQVPMLPPAFGHSSHQSKNRH